eukprot:Gb_30817 [translate_table: standard]
MGCMELLPVPASVFWSARVRQSKKGLPSTVFAPTFRVDLKRLSDKRKGRFAVVSKNVNGNGFLPPEDVYYVCKLTLGCIAGAAVIKYGSVFLPVITRPNLTQALLMIGAPVLVSILLLLRVSSTQRLK